MKMVGGGRDHRFMAKAICSAQKQPLQVSSSNLFNLMEIRPSKQSQIKRKTWTFQKWFLLLLKQVHYYTPLPEVKAHGHEHLK